VAWHLELLAEPRLVGDDGRSFVLERKDAALFALLALEGPQPRARVAALLWPDADPLKARRNLRQRLFRLHRRAGVVLLDAHDPVGFTKAASVDIDLADAMLATDATACAGDLLGVHGYDDCPELAAWLDMARERWRSRRLSLLTAQAAAHERQGDLAAALACAERLQADEPLHELGHRLVIRLHYLRGDRAAALAAYERCRRVLHEELATTPSAETEALVALARRSGTPGAAAPAPAAGLRRPPKLVGRSPAWRRLQQVWQAGGVLLVRGEPGLGKSRLVGDFIHTRTALHASLTPSRRGAPAGPPTQPVAGATAPWLVTVDARAGDAGVPYALLARWLHALHASGVSAALPPDTCRELARLLPALGTPPRAPLARARFDRALDDALRQAIAAGLAGVVVEDLHFADAASLDHLPRLAAAAPLPWLLTLRPGEQPPAVDAWLQRDAGEALPVLDLQPLGVSATRELLASLALPGLDPATLAPTLRHHAGGNPLFMLETLRLWDARRDPRRLPAPPLVQALIGRRLRQLSTSALNLLRVAALAGPDFGAALAAEVIGGAAVDLAEPWLELEAAQLLHGERFVHDMVRVAAQRSVPRPVAGLLHGAIAEALARAHAPPARIAAHRTAARDWSRAGHAWLQAAEASRLTSRLGEQTQALAQAEACFARAGDRAGRVAALARWFDSALVVDALSEARRIARRMQRLARSATERAEAAIAAATLHNLAWDGRRALGPAAEAVRLAAAPACLGLQLRAAQQLAHAEGAAGRPQQALAGLRPWLARLDEPGVDAAVACSVLSCQAWLLEVADRRREAVAAYAAAIERALAQEQYAAAHAALTDQAVALYYLGELAASHAAYLRARDLRDRISGGKGWSRLDDMALGGHERELGHFGDALALLEPTAAALRDEGFGVWAAAAENELATTWVALGQPARAQQALGALPSACPDWARAGRLIVLARIERALGRPSTPLLAQALALLGTAFGRSYLRLRAEVEWLAETDPGHACRRLAEIRTQVVAREQFGLLRLVAVHHIDALLRAGDAAAAAALAAQDRVLFEDRLPIVVEAPLAWWTLHRAFVAGGRPRAAAAALARARHWIVEQALPQVPPALRDGFLNRNRIHRAVLAAARIPGATLVEA
jgi:DNA-binding SARP family transcriptional activator